MSKDSLKSKINELLVESYPGMFEDFDKYVMQNHVLNARQKLEILFMMFADKVENNAVCATESLPPAVDYDVLRMTLASPTKMWKDMSLEEKSCIVHFLNNGATVYFSEHMKCDDPSKICESNRTVYSLNWEDEYYYWISHPANSLDDETKYRLAVVVEELEKEVYEPLKTPSRPWGEMSRLQKETIAQHLNSGQTVKFTETLPCWVECVVIDSYRSVSSTRWSSGLYYWIV